MLRTKEIYVECKINGKNKKIKLDDIKQIIPLREVYKYPYGNSIEGVIVYMGNIYGIIEQDEKNPKYAILLNTPPYAAILTSYIGKE